MIYVSRLIRQGYSIYFNNDDSVVKNKCRICISYHTSNLFYLQPNILLLHNIENDGAQTKPSHKKAKVSTNNETYLWHLWLDHINQNIIERLVNGGPLNSLEVKPLPTCESCLEGKMTKRTFSRKGQRVQECLELVHTDVYGASKCSSLGRFQILFNIHQWPF